MPPSRPRRSTVVAILACAFLVGWSNLLVPALIRSIEADFAQDDAGLGLFFFVYALASATGAVASGLLAERVGRRVVLTSALVLMATALVARAVVPAWGLFLLAAVPYGLGSGAMGGSSSGLFLDLFPTGRGRALNTLHLFFSLGSLASPLFVGRLLEAGVSWQAITAGTAVAAAVLATAVAVVPLPPDPERAPPGAATRGPRTLMSGWGWPLAAMAIAIGCYCASELGVSSWLVRFLESASVGLATAALAVFWGCLALGRLASAIWSDRFDHARLGAVAALVGSLALAAAAVVPSVPVAIALFGVVGFAFGPVFPLIMAVAGDRYPARAAAVSGLLTGAATVGVIVYPPVMGVVSVTSGLGLAMLGAAAMALACAAILFLLARRPHVVATHARKAQDRPMPRSVGAGADGTVGARDSEAWLKAKWGQPEERSER